MDDDDTWNLKVLMSTMILLMLWFHFRMKIQMLDHLLCMVY